MDTVRLDVEALDGEDALDAALAEPTPELVDLMGRLSGDLAVLGVAGKMGLTLARMARAAADRAGVKKRVIGVSRFGRPGDREKLAARGVETVACDLLDRDAVARLPRVENVVFMAGRKFGTVGAESDTWAMNTLAPALAADHFRGARFVAFSTGCVYPLVDSASGGCDESRRPQPVGEYAQSCLGRERLFEDAAKRFGARVLLFRLNYAIDLR
jgi:nucleoside-diphosphate-sugar epimerase